MSTQWQHQDSNGLTKFNAYVVDYSLDLFSDFTYDLYDANNYYNETANPITCNAAFTTCKPNSGAGALRAPNYSSYCPAYTAPKGAAVDSITPVPYDFQCGDQREQEDKGVISGFNFSRAFVTPGMLTTVGIDTPRSPHARWRYAQPRVRCNRAHAPGPERPLMTWRFIAALEKN